MSQNVTEYAQSLVRTKGFTLALWYLDKRILLAGMDREFLTRTRTALLTLQKDRT